MKLSKVQETLLFPLIGRYRAAEKWPEYFSDRFAKKIVKQFGEVADKKELNNFSNLSYGLRYKINMDLAKEYLKEHPNASVVNLGAGLDSLYEDIDNKRMYYYSLDLPDVVELREKLLPKYEREENIAIDIMDFSWMDKIKYNKNDGIIFLSAGVFYWFDASDIKSLINELSKRFPNGRLTFDNESPAIMKKGNKVMKKKGIEVEMKFFLNDPEDIKGWSDNIKDIRTIYDMSSILPDNKKIPLYAKIIFKYMKKKKGMYQTIIDFK